jgi:hypothetical protein
MALDRVRRESTEPPWRAKCDRHRHNSLALSPAAADRHGGLRDEIIRLIQIASF